MKASNELENDIFSFSNLIYVFKSRINDLLAILHGEAETLKAVNGSRLKLTENDVAQIKRLI